jgi:methionyl-tRNA formyltransferase
MKIIFAGTPENAALGLELVSVSHEVVLVVTREDAEVGRKRILTPSPVAAKAVELGLPVLKANRIREQELEVIKAAGADLALVIAYGSLIPEAGLEVLSWWNIHFSLLPLWRGASPLQQSILSGGIGAGVTLFELDPGMDTGPIIGQQEIALGESETTGDALPRFTRVGVNMFTQFAGKEATALPQIGQATLAPKITRAMAKLDLNKSAQQIHQAVMAFNPEPMAWCELDGNPIRILETKAVGTAVGAVASVGRVAKVGEKVLLECAAGSQLELIKVHPSGKQVMPASDWFRGLGKGVQLA